MDEPLLRFCLKKADDLVKEICFGEQLTPVRYVSLVAEYDRALVVAEFAARGWLCNQ
jgi:hypothetical protein